MKPQISAYTAGPAEEEGDYDVKDRHPFPVDQLNQMQRYLGEEMIEDYHTGELTRRQMLKRLLGICGSAAAAAALLAACGEGTAAPPAATAGAAPPSAVPPAADLPTAAPAEPTAAPAGRTAQPAATAAAPAAANGCWRGWRCQPALGRSRRPRRGWIGRDISERHSYQRLCSAP